MSNLLIGIAGIVLFVMMALAGANFFGPKVTESTVRAKAVSIMESLASVSNAIAVRNVEKQTVTPAGYDLNDLLPDYLAELPRSAMMTNDPQLLGVDGDLSGAGHYVAVKLTGDDAADLCSAISKVGLGPSIAPSSTAMPNSYTVGCFRATGNISTYVRSGDRVAYAISY